MGAALSYCTPGISRAILDAPLSTAAVGDDTLVIHVEEASVEASLGAAVFDFKAQTELTLRRIRAEPGLEPLSARFRDGARQHVGDGGARSRSGARSWCVEVTGGSASTRRPVPCVLQVPILLEDRTAKRVRMDVADASDAAAYATRFNLHHQQHADGEEVPLVKVAVPIVCTVKETCFPAMIPTGTACTLIPYPCSDVHKYVFDGSEDFLELPQAYFHCAAFSTNGKCFVCDVQGTELDSGDFLLIDPCVLRAERPNVDAIVRAAAAPVAAGAGFAQEAAGGPTGERFDALHPKCAQLCHTFDPHRKTAKRNVGVCGVGTCGFGR